MCAIALCYSRHLAGARSSLGLSPAMLGLLALCNAAAFVAAVPQHVLDLAPTLCGTDPLDMVSRYIHGIVESGAAEQRQTDVVERCSGSAALTSVCRAADAQCVCARLLMLLMMAVRTSSPSKACCMQHCLSCRCEWVDCSGAVQSAAAGYRLRGL